MLRQSIPLEMDDMRIFAHPVLVFLLCLAAGPAAAADVQFTGTPAVLPSGLIMIGGHNVSLWGIDPLAIDQKCWHEERSWDCGDEALTVLRHYLTNSQTRCDVKSDDGKGALSAQCFRTKAGKETDVAGYMVSQGWARDNIDESDGLYAKEQEDARRKRRGIWTSRFQSAEDWKNGVPHYVQYQMAPPKPPVPGKTPDKPE
jgi:endonuclease YncB( thermonuclease family)